MPPHHLRVLIADDNRDAAEMLAELLSLMSRVPLTIVVAFDGQQVVIQAQSPAPSDVVILDIEMPVMDGFEAAATIRQALGDRAPLLIALSENGRTIDLAASESAFDHALHKPVGPQRLLALLDGAHPGGSSGH